MAKKIMWLLVSCLMVLSLLISSCGSDKTNEGTVTNEDDGQIVITDNTQDQSTPDVVTTPNDANNAPSTDVTADDDKPQYGGKLTIITNTDVSVWNPGAVAGRGAEQDGIMLEQILGVNRLAGPAGTGETNYIGGVTDFKYVVGNLAESWETPEVGVWILNIRKGVHFTYNPEFAASALVAGREMTAEDVAASIEYMRDNPTSSTNFSEPTLIKNVTVDRTGEWQITVNTPVSATTGYLWIMGGGGVQYVWPKEWLEQYASSNNWYDVVATGPYMVNDYISGSAVKYVRNDNYWDTNSVGPGTGDMLPYPDEMTWQVIPDYSTRLAALRTGKADTSFIDVLKREELNTVLNGNPDLKYAQTIIDPIQISGRVDLDGPYGNLDVRRAMMLAIDQPSIAKDLYGGEAELLDSPARKWYSTIYTPLDELPESTQELYGYDPEKAKQLLAGAGYPDGFKIKMYLQNTPAMEEVASLTKAYWSQVGIDLELQVVEPSIFIGMWAGYKVEDLMLSQYPGGNGALFVRYSLGYYRGPNIFNMSHVNNPPGTDPTIENAYNIQSKSVMVDYPTADKALKDVIPYILDQAFLIPMPAPWGYRIWQPWVKNYYGEAQLKFWLRYAWIDQALKTSMTSE